MGTREHVDVGAPEERADLTSDVVFDILSNQRRRNVIRYLDRQGDEVDLSELSTRLAAWENDLPPSELTAGQRKTVYTALRQSHLPKMDEEGVLEFDDETGVVELTEAGDQLEAYIEVVSGREIPWSEYYLALGAVSLALVAAVWVDAYPLSLVPPLAWAAVIAGVVTLSGAVHVLTRRRV